MGRKSPGEHANPEGWNLKGISLHIRQLRAKVLEIAQKPVTVLIQGPSGTGKELIAKDIHARSPRKNREFVAVNCGAIPAELFESELFGHERGAFTGADRKRKGLVELADGGTLFLDEVGALRPDHQVKLLRFLENKSYRPLGADTERKVDVRVVAATNKDLLQKVRNGTFQEDLYYRLSQSTIRTSPLKDRPEDLVFLVNFFQKEERLKIDSSHKVLLYSYYYPGNVRQLKNFLYNDKKNIIEEAIEELIYQGFNREDISRIQSYDDFYRIYQEARRYIIYPRKKTLNEMTEEPEPLPALVDKILFDDDIYHWLEAICFVCGNKDDLTKIIESYEIITLYGSGMPKYEIAKLLRIRKENLSPEKFSVNYGFPFPELNNPSSRYFFGRFYEFPLYREILYIRQKMIERAILEQFKS